MNSRMLIVLAIVFCGVFLLVIPGSLVIPATVIWFVSIAYFMADLIRYHARNTLYSCSKCGHLFGISALTDAISPHTGDSKYLKCPNCGNKGMFAEFVRETR